MRLLKANDGWWAVTDTGGHVVKLPGAAAEPAVAVIDSDWYGDRERRVRLTAEAVKALDAVGLGPAAEDPDGQTYAVTVLTATTCNLGCNYCFQNTAMAEAGSFAPPRIKAAQLSQDDVAAIAAFVKAQQAKYLRPRSSLLVFGGEPLLNKPGTLQLLSAFEPLGLVDAEIVTNGVLLSGNMAKQMHERGLNRVQITFDGDKSAHDVTRVTRNGRGTYDKIMSNVAAAMQVAPELSWNFRVNVSHRNVDGLSALVTDLGEVLQSGVDASFHLALIDDTGLGYNNDVGYDQSLAITFAKLYCLAVDQGLKVYPSPLVKDCPYCGITGGDGGAVINGDGSLFSCWENAGRDGWSVGDVREGYVTDHRLAERWVDCHFDSASHGDASASRAFHDFIDVSVLEYQYSRNALQSVR